MIKQRDGATLIGYATAYQELLRELSVTEQSILAPQEPYRGEHIKKYS
jgi:hypothetical protein